MRIKCNKCEDGYIWGEISQTYLNCVTCNGKGYITGNNADNTIYRTTDSNEIKSGFYNDLKDLDKRMWAFLPITDTKPLLIETSLCNLFNGYFGFNLLRHPVNNLNDLKGYYV